MHELEEMTRNDQMRSLDMSESPFGPLLARHS